MHKDQATKMQEKVKIKFLLNIRIRNGFIILKPIQVPKGKIDIFDYVEI